MFFANYILKDRVSKIRTQYKNILTSTELVESEKSKTYGFLYDMKLAINELIVATADNDYNAYLNFINNNLQLIKNTTENNEFIEILNSLILRFENIDYSAYIYTDRHYDTYNSCKIINDNFIRSVVSKISAINNRNINIFDTTCKEGELLKAAKEINKNAICYGLESSNMKAEIAKQHATKIIKGVLKGSRIKNDAFDLLIANCPIQSTLEGNMAYGSIYKEERGYIQNIIKYLNTDGVVIIGIPYYRLHKDICTLIAKHFTNVSIVQGFGSNQDKMHTVYIVGQKSNSKDVDEDIYNRLRICYDKTNIPYLFDITLDTYTLQSKFVEVDMLKGSVLDMEELHNIVEASGCINHFLEKQKVDKIHENTKRPLLPFNVGQIGLVLTSGCLDGIIDEGDGHYHLVKGRVSKKSQVTRETSDGTMQEREVVSNKVEINVILPNGDFKTLA